MDLAKTVRNVAAGLAITGSILGGGLWYNTQRHFNELWSRVLAYNEARNWSIAEIGPRAACALHG